MAGSPRVVSLQPSVTVTLQRLGVLNCVVACTKYCADVVPEVRSAGIRIISDSWSAKAEEILAAKPDVVIASVPYQLESLAEILKSGTRFLALAPKTLADIYGDISTIAALVHRQAQGEEVVGQMQQEIARVREAARGPRLRVFVEEWGKPIIRSQPWVAELVEAAGGEFAGEPGAKTDAEVVRAQNPEVLIAAWCGAGDRVPLEKIVLDRGWQELSAVRDRRVYCVRDELLNTPAPTLIEGLHALCWALHPDRIPQPVGIRRVGQPVSPGC